MKEVTELFERLLPQAESLDNNMARFLEVFPRGVVPETGEAFELSDLALVREFDWQLLSQLPVQGSDSGDPRSRASLCAWVDGVLLCSGKIPDHRLAVDIAKSVARWRLNAEKIAKAPRKNRDVSRHAAYPLGHQSLRVSGLKSTGTTLQPAARVPQVLSSLLQKKLHARAFYEKIAPNKLR